MIHDIFKIPVYQKKLDLDLKKLNVFCNDFQKTNISREISNLGGYQSKELNNDSELLKNLGTQIEKHASLFAKEFINNEHQHISNCWFNVNYYKDSNSPHVHPRSEIAGVIYIKAPSDCGSITFLHPIEDLISFYDCDMNIKNFNSYNSHCWEFIPEENVIYLFPAWLKHSVQPNLNKNEERISFSFNTEQMLNE